MQVVHYGTPYKTIPIFEKYLVDTAAPETETFYAKT